VPPQAVGLTKARGLLALHPVQRRRRDHQPVSAVTKLSIPEIMP
jgi:hypothetical protein